jgi:tRNA U54 and U55 pseudouridine synthase Pus10
LLDAVTRQLLLKCVKVANKSNIQSKTPSRVTHSRDNLNIKLDLTKTHHVLNTKKNLLMLSMEICIAAIYRQNNTKHSSLWKRVGIIHYLEGLNADCIT